MKLNRERYLDKVLGCWAGKNIGGTLGARILVGEFSAVAWAEGADQYLRDSISVFEELGFDWTYHEFGGWGWKGWNVEVDVEGRGKEAKYTKSEGNPRKRALLDGLARWKLDNAPEGK